MVRGTVALPHGTGKDVTVLCFVLQIRSKKRKMLELITYGLDDYIAKIKGGWTDVDVIVTMPAVMGKVGA